MRTMATAGRAVVVSGLAVAIGLGLLSSCRCRSSARSASAGSLIPLVSIAAALTLQPVLLSLLGARGVRRLPGRARIPRVEAGALGTPRADRHAAPAALPRSAAPCCWSRRAAGARARADARLDLGDSEIARVGARLRAPAGQHRAGRHHARVRRGRREAARGRRGEPRVRRAHRSPGRPRVPRRGDEGRRVGDGRALRRPDGPLRTRHRRRTTRVRRAADAALRRAAARRARPGAGFPDDDSRRRRWRAAAGRRLPRPRLRRLPVARRARCSRSPTSSCCAPSARCCCHSRPCC